MRLVIARKSKLTIPQIRFFFPDNSIDRIDHAKERNKHKLFQTQFLYYLMHNFCCLKIKLSFLKISDDLKRKKMGNSAVSDLNPYR